MDGLVTSSPSRLASLQVYRGLAAALVLLYHVTWVFHQRLAVTFLHDAFAFGHSGVDLFFVLSGFIILHTHRLDLGRPERFKAYALKRLFRIYPTYLIVTAAILPIYFAHPAFGTGHEREPLTILRSLALWPQPPDRLPVLTVAWTLSHEAWFYLLFGCAILLPRRVTAVGATLLTAASVLLWLFELATIRDPSKTAYPHGFALSAYNLEFAFGCLASHMVSRAPARHPLWIIGAGVVLFAIAGAFDGWLVGHFGNSYRILSYGVPSFMLVLGSASLDLQRRVSWPALLIGLGDASYSIYLTHLLPIVVLRKIWAMGHLPTDGLANALMFIALSMALGILCGSLTYSYFEKPMLGYLRQRLGLARQRSGRIAEPQNVA